MTDFFSSLIGAAMLTLPNMGPQAAEGVCFHITALQDVIIVGRFTGPLTLKAHDEIEFERRSGEWRKPLRPCSP